MTQLAVKGSHLKHHMLDVAVVFYGALATGFAFLAALVPGPVTQVHFLTTSYRD